jgi:hypothetical protein
MPYCGRCLNVGRAGKRGAPPEYLPTSTSTAVCYFVKLNRLRTGPACDLREARRSWTSYRVNTWTGQWGEALQDQYCFLAWLKRTQRSQLARDGRRPGAAAPTLDIHGEER